MTDDVLTSHSILFLRSPQCPGSRPQEIQRRRAETYPPLSEEETSAALSDLREASPVEPFTSPVPVLEQESWLPGTPASLRNPAPDPARYRRVGGTYSDFSLILSLMGWLPWSAPTVSFVVLAGIGGALYYLGAA